MLVKVGDRSTPQSSIHLLRTAIMRRKQLAGSKIKMDSIDFQGATVISFKYAFNGLTV